MIPVAGGVASFAGEGSPYNKVAGLGFRGVPDPAALDDIEKAFADRGSPVQVELAHLAGPATGALLAGRGYRLEAFENVLGRALAGGPERVMPPGVEVRLIADDGGTRVGPGHGDPPVGQRPGNVSGWAYYLARLRATSARFHFCAGMG